MTRVLLLAALLAATTALAAGTASAASPGPRPEASGRFEPDHGQVLVFIGQDNASVGGNAGYRDGYVDRVGWIMVLLVVVVVLFHGLGG